MVAETREGLRGDIRTLYHGSGPLPRLFRISLLIFDLSTLAFFIATTFIEQGTFPWIRPVELTIAAIIAIHIALRQYIAPDRLRQLMQIGTLADILVVVTLVVLPLVMPILSDSFAFLRAIRALALIRSYAVLRELRQDYAYFRKNQEVIESAINLVVFVFIASALVHLFQAHVPGSQIENFVDALYFTVATLRTTGFGDITLKGDGGHLLSVAIMIFGVSLFLRLLQTIFRPAKVNQECTKCGLTRHEPDAIHCKHCGTVIFIPNEGE